MALVDYPSSDEDEKETAPTKDNATSDLKRKREDESLSDLPPLPSKFHDLYASTTRVSTRDDPSLHGGRKRVTPHIEGNWPTHLYIEWYPSNAEYVPLTNLISTLKDGILTEDAGLKIHSFLTSDLGAPLPLHISLSRPIGFSAEHKDEFVASLDRAIKSSSIRPFDISFSDLDWVANFENTRWFLVLRLQKPEMDGLNKLLHISNKVIQEYDQPPLYAKSATPSRNSKSKTWTRTAPKCDWTDMKDVSNAFHISIAWTLGAPGQKLLELTETTANGYMEQIRQTKVKVEEVKSKVGNGVTSFPLPKTVSVGKGLFGI